MIESINYVLNIRLKLYDHIGAIHLSVSDSYNDLGVIYNDIEKYE